MYFLSSFSRQCGGPVALLGFLLRCVSFVASSAAFVVVVERRSSARSVRAASCSALLFAVARRSSAIRSFLCTTPKFRTTLSRSSFMVCSCCVYCEPPTRHSRHPASLPLPLFTALGGFLLPTAGVSYFVELLSLVILATSSANSNLAYRHPLYGISSFKPIGFCFFLGGSCSNKMRLQDEHYLDMHPWICYM